MVSSVVLFAFSIVVVFLSWMSATLSKNNCTHRKSLTLIEN